MDHREGESSGWQWVAGGNSERGKLWTSGGAQALGNGMGRWEAREKNGYRFGVKRSEWERDGASADLESCPFCFDQRLAVFDDAKSSLAPLTLVCVLWCWSGLVLPRSMTWTGMCFILGMGHRVGGQVAGILPEVEDTVCTSCVCCCGPFATEGEEMESRGVFLRGRDNVRGILLIYYNLILQLAR